jgi:phosphoserine/homoserine phosphotransferase
MLPANLPAPPTLIPPSNSHALSYPSPETADRHPGGVGHFSYGLKLSDIQEVIATLKPLDGAIEFVDWLRERFQVVILSDTFYEFSQPLMRQLGFPTLLCHRLITDDSGRVTDYQLRQKDPKRQSVLAFKSLYYRVIAAGDSYNDTTMLGEADAGILFHAPDNVIAQFPQFPAVHTFEELKQEFIKASNRTLSV